MNSPLTNKETARMLSSSTSPSSSSSSSSACCGESSSSCSDSCSSSSLAAGVCCGGNESDKVHEKEQWEKVLCYSCLRILSDTKSPEEFGPALPPTVHKKTKKLMQESALRSHIAEFLLEDSDEEVDGGFGDDD